MAAIHTDSCGYGWFIADITYDATLTRATPPLRIAGWRLRRHDVMISR